MQKFDFDDILITPESYTTINSRSKIDNKYSGVMFPIIAAPMDTVVNENNYRTFIRQGISVALPRTVKNKPVILETTYPFIFNSYGLKEFEDTFCWAGKLMPTKYALIDIANGHMKQILNLAEKAKEVNPELVIMAGNIANPETYLAYIKSGVIDFARVGIGNGNGCLTSEQTGVGYPNASLIRECFEIKGKAPSSSHTKIVADGGMKKYSDIIKALALGADYVMIGSIFNKAFESAAPCYWGKIKLAREFSYWMFEMGFDIHKNFRGMSTKQVQKDLGNDSLRTAEGIVKKQRVEYFLWQWLENFDDYLKSTMSYCNAKSLTEFIGYAEYEFITENAFKRYNK